MVASGIVVSDTPRPQRSAPLQRNSSHCGHCGKTFVRITNQTPLVNRSDGFRYHVTLFSGPDPRPKPSGGFYSDQVLCEFAYAHDQLGPKDHTVLVVITHTKPNPEDILREVEEAADKLAELLERGYALTAAYRFSGRVLV